MLKNSTSTEKTAAVLALAAIALFFYLFKTGNTKLSISFLIVAFGAAIMLFASKKSKHKD